MQIINATHNMCSHGANKLCLRSFGFLFLCFQKYYIALLFSTRAYIDLHRKLLSHASLSHKPSPPPPPPPPPPTTYHLPPSLPTCLSLKHPPPPPPKPDTSKCMCNNIILFPFPPPLSHGNVIRSERMTG